MNACYVYDFTASAQYNKQENIKTWLEENCKRWAFQLEKGETVEDVEDDYSDSETDSSNSESSEILTSTSGTTNNGNTEMKGEGYLHYQGRFSLKSKLRKRNVIALVKASDLKWHVSTTCKKNLNNFDYVTKKATRVDGPWTNEDQEMPEHLKQFIWLPWCQAVKDDLEKHDWRSINWVWDPKGCKGKSWLVDMLLFQKLAYELEPTRDFERMSMNMASMHNQWDCRRGIMVDFPRKFPPKAMDDVLTALEKVKGGRFNDMRHKAHPHMCVIKPNVWCFANFFPEYGSMSNDRWKIYRISDRDELIEIEHPGKADYEKAKKNKEEEYIIKDKN